LVPHSVLHVWRLLLDAGCKTYLVGGCVRDALLGIEPEDYDLCTSCTPNQVEQVLKSAGFPVYETGIEFGTVMTVVDGVEVEITTMRREQYYYDRGRKPFVVFTDDVYEDLSRRDFTINAIAMDIEGRIIDPFGGVDDLRRGIVRFVGAPEERIREDPLRMLRALRFAAKLGFRIDDRSWEAIRSNWRELERVSWERIRDEVLKAAKTPRFHLFAQLLYESNLYRYVMPEMGEMARVRHAPDTPNHRGETVLEHTIDALRRLDDLGAEPIVKIAVLLHDVGKPATAEGEVSRRFHGHDRVGAEIALEICRRWKMSGAESSRIAAAVWNHMVPHQLASTGMRSDRIARKLVARLGTVTARDVLLIAYADTGDQRYLEALREVERIETMQENKPVVTGRDIMEAFNLPPGPWIGEIKRALYEIQLTEGIKDRDTLLRIAIERGIVQRAIERLAKPRDAATR